MTRKEIEQLYVEEPNCFETDREEQWYKVGLKEGLAAADSHPHWIPVEEELPPKRKDPLVISDKVFIRTTGGYYLSAVYDYQDKQWIEVYNIETFESNEVTHWMPIEPPRKEDENDV